MPMASLRLHCLLFSFATLVPAEGDHVLLVGECVGVAIHVLVTLHAGAGAIHRYVPMVALTARGLPASPLLVSVVVEEGRAARPIAVDEQDRGRAGRQRLWRPLDHGEAIGASAGGFGPKGGDGPRGTHGLRPRLGGVPRKTVRHKGA